MHPKETKGKAGRKPKLSLRDERSIIRSLHYACKNKMMILLQKESDFILVFPVFMTGQYAEY